MTAQVLTVEDYQAAAIGDRFRSIMDIIDLLQGFDLGKVTELLDIVGKIGSAATLKDAVKLSLQAFKIIASMTPTEADDKIVAILDSVLSDELLDIITKIVGGFLGAKAQAKYGIASAEQYTITAADRTVLEAKGIPVSFLFDIALKLLPLLERFFASK